MLRWSLTVTALATLMPIAAAQDRPKLTLVLPSGIASETVQIEYFLTGPFGGHRGFIRAERKRASYDIEPFVDDRPAEDIKIIAYVPGCEIAVSDLTFSGIPVERRLDCYPIGSVSFRGQVLPASTIREHNREIEVSYLAMWSLQFYGIIDGQVTTIRLGTVRPDWDGKFEITLPDLYKQSRLRDGAIQFILRDVKTGNIVAFLKPREAMANSPDWLSVQASYPIVQLIAEGQQQPTRP